MNKINDGNKIYIIDLEIETEIEMSQDFNSLLLPPTFLCQWKLFHLFPVFRMRDTCSVFT